MHHLSLSLLVLILAINVIYCCAQHRQSQTTVSQPSPLFDLDANAAYLTINVDNAEKCVAEACWLPHQLPCIQIMFWKKSLSHKLSPSRSTFPAFGLALAVESFLTLRSHVFQGVTERERLKIMLIVAAWQGQKGGWGGVVIHLFHSLLRAVLKDLPTLSAQAFS